MTPRPPDQPADVLIVDDDAAIRRLAIRALDGLAVVVREVGCAADAEEEIRRQTPDLILLDVMMPGVNGLEFCATLRENDATRDIPVLVMTGQGDLDVLERAYGSGATDFLTKPVPPLILQNRVRYLLRSSAAFRELRESRERLADAQSIAHVGNWEFDREDETFAWSEELFRIFEIRPSSQIPADLYYSNIHPDDVGAVRSAWATTLESGVPHEITYRLCVGGSHERFLSERAEVRVEPGGRRRYVGTIQDITERKEAEDKIRFLAYRDTLTGLPNRKLFQDRLGQAVAAARRAGSRVAVLHLDIDRFKAINDGFGHSVGDELLRRAADRLRSCLRDSDTVARHIRAPDATLSRFGGDEFMLVLTDIQTDVDPAAVAERLMSQVAEPFAIRDAELLVSASMGIAVYPNDGSDADTLMRRAHTAMTHAKEQGGDCFLYYDEAMNTNAAMRLEMASRLHHALEEGGFQLEYQPIFDTHTEEVVSVEALVRWDDPKLGPVEPSLFVAVAEETGLILPLGEWVLDQACAQWRAWLDAGIGPVEMSVNVSGRQFRDAHLVDKLETMLATHGVDPCFLNFELTERVLMSYTDITESILARLRALGVGLVVDDFGTGYSSLNYLRRFPVDILKIDRSFVRGVPENREDASLVAAIVAMAHKLRLQVVAEGLENRNQLEFLRALGCDQLQGFLLGAAARGDDLAPLLRKRLRRPQGPSVLAFQRPAGSA